MKKVLIIDDSQKVLFVTEKLIKLVLPDVNTYTADSGLEGLELISSIKPNVILLDILMPATDGYEVCEKVKNNPETEDIPVILVSSLEYNKENRLKAIEAGADAFLSKPIDKEEMVLQLKAMLKINEGNLRKKSEQQRLEKLVAERTQKLQTELKLRIKTEKELHKSEEKFKEISELASDYAYSYKRKSDGKFLLEWYFGAFKKITGFNPIKIIDSTNYLKIIHQEDWKKAEKRIKKLDKGKTATTELRIVTKPGKVKWIREKSKPELDKKGNLLRVVSSAQEVTKEKIAQQIIKKHEQSLQIVLENIPYAVFAHDKEGNFQFINKMATVYTGYTEEELMKLSVGHIDKKSIKQKYKEKIWKNLSAGKHQKVFSEHIRKDGSTYPVEVTVTEIKLNDKPTILAIVQDITERKKAEKELKESAKELKELNATKDKFFSIIAHDLKSPFGSVLGLSDLLMQKIEEGDQSQLYHLSSLLYKAANQSFDLLNNLLEWSRTQSGRKKFKPEMLKLCNLIKELIELFSLTAKEKDVELEVECAESAQIFADPNMLESVMRNLISNAIKYSFEGGKITISVSKDTDELKIAVKDEGTGISERVQSRLFQIGEDVSTLGTKDEKGTGLGLILCKEFVEIHGGKIWVDSEPQKGSVFQFTLPLKH